MASRYNDILRTNQGVPYFKGKVYPNIPLSANDVYVITTVGDRLDSLANSYYNDSTLWWVISMANNNITKGASVSGFFSYGEIAPQKDKKISHLHNQTMTVTTFAELP
jgi:hypothetical protein